MTPHDHTRPATPAGPGASAPGGRVSRVLRFLPALTLASVVTVTSTSEWTLARTVLDLPPAVAWAVPVAIDSYVIAALRMSVVKFSGPTVVTNVGPGVGLAVS